MVSGLVCPNYVSDRAMSIDMKYRINVTVCWFRNQSSESGVLCLLCAARRL